MEDILYLDLRKYHLNIYDNNIEIMMYGSVNILKTFYKLYRSKLVLSCEYLIGNHLTNYNSFLLASYINYNKLILFDDGIGTPVILRNPNYYNLKYTHIFKNIFVKLIYRRIFNKLFLLPDTLVNIIDHYYTIYDKLIPQNINSTTINIYTKKDNSKYSKCTVFVGAPLIDYKYITISEYISILLEIQKNEKYFIYYAHPMEKWFDNIKLEGITFQSYTLPLEFRFLNEGLPSRVIGFTSSTLISLKIICPQLKIYYLHDNYSRVTIKNMIKEYIKILEIYKIEKYDICGGK